jgi:hypothetical protein
MLVAKKRSQLLALVGLGLELLMRDRTEYADDAEFLVWVEATPEAQADHCDAAQLINAVHYAVDVSRVYVQIMGQARRTLKQTGIQLLDGSHSINFEEAERNLTAFLRALRATVREATKRRLQIDKLRTGIATSERIKEASAALFRSVERLQTVMSLPTGSAPHSNMRCNSAAILPPHCARIRRSRAAVPAATPYTQQSAARRED